MQTVKLNNGVEMTQMGYGVYQVSPAECERCVADALSVGYRMIDTAQAYHNEDGVGNAIRKSGIDRKDIFLVSNFYPDHFIDIASNMEIVPAVNQVETHVFDQQIEPQRIMAYYGMTDTMGRMHSDAQFAGSSSVPAHVEMMGFLGIGNNPMVGCTVACAVDITQALGK